MLGLNSGIYRVLCDLFFEVLIGNIIKLRAGYGLALVLYNAELQGYCNSGVLVVAGYHYGSYAGTATFLDCRLTFGPYGVYHTYKAAEDELIFDIIGRLILGNT